jgi:hypothetical protein
MPYASAARRRRSTVGAPRPTRGNAPACGPAALAHGARLILVGAHAREDDVVLLASLEGIDAGHLDALPRTAPPPTRKLTMRCMRVPVPVRMRVSVSAGALYSSFRSEPWLCMY